MHAAEVAPGCGARSGPAEVRGGSSEEDPRADLLYGSVPRLVTRAAELYGSSSAVEDDERRLGFDDLEREAFQAARALLAAGVDVGDRVALWAPNSLRWVVAALGVLGAGAVLVPLNTRFKGAEAADVIRRSGARILVAVGEFLGVDYPSMLVGEEIPGLELIVVLGAGPSETRRAAMHLPQVEAWEAFVQRGAAVAEEAARSRWEAVTGDDLSDVIFTSGTTGYPKGATATHAQTLRTFGTWTAIAGLERGDRYLVVNPFFHTFGYKAGIIACLLSGATIIPEPVFDPERVRQRVLSSRVTVLPGPPALYQSLLASRSLRPGAESPAQESPAQESQHAPRLALRLAVTGASVVPVELVQRMGDELGCDTVLTAYGLTEATGVVTMCRRGDPPEIVANSCGRPIPGVEVEVVDAEGRFLPPGSAGEVLVRGYNVTAGYLGDPEATAAAIDTAGWLHTGDVGILDASCNLRICDRLKDMFIVGGFNVYPAEVERILSQHPDVAALAVVGVPDERLGEVGVAFVVARSEEHALELPASLVAFARERMANYKVPRRVLLVDELPVNAGGKVTKGVLREMATKAALEPSGTQ